LGVVEVNAAVVEDEAQAYVTLMDKNVRVPTSKHSLSCIDKVQAPFTVPENSAAKLAAVDAYPVGPMASVPSGR
jgi:hypothetical protein